MAAFVAAKNEMSSYEENQASKKPGIFDEPVAEKERYPRTAQRRNK